jgi:hypothetical protein
LILNLIYDITLTTYLSLYLAIALPDKIVLSSHGWKTFKTKMMAQHFFAKASSLSFYFFNLKFYNLPWIACGRYKLIRQSVSQSVEMTLRPPEEFPEDGPDAR